jgi:hypothetical protein
MRSISGISASISSAAPRILCASACDLSSAPNVAVVRPPSSKSGSPIARSTKLECDQKSWSACDARPISA